MQSIVMCLPTMNKVLTFITTTMNAEVSKARKVKYFSLSELYSHVHIFVYILLFPVFCFSGFPVCTNMSIFVSLCVPFVFISALFLLIVLSQYGLLVFLLLHFIIILQMPAFFLKSDKNVVDLKERRSKKDLRNQGEGKP